MVFNQRIVTRLNSLPVNYIIDNWKGDLILKTSRILGLLEVTMLSCSASMLYVFFLQKIALSELMKSIVKKPILPYVKTLTLEMVVNDHNDDVEVPYVRLVTSSKTINNIQITESSER
ncbi:unnamed protein product [Rhizophagus irregularis]|nr:unnamed protein product [Rhizophagus irregularis]CAB4425204.1 unnamed protein product [Rhizophagus irregularis]